ATNLPTCRNNHREQAERARQQADGPSCKIEASDEFPGNIPATFGAQKLHGPPGFETISRPVKPPDPDCLARILMIVAA
ncbi:hypothetical protein ACWHAU_31525, partial [Streptomyces albidoflavus]